MRKIEVFYHFGEILNMTKVAEILCVSQSAVSQTIKELENEFEVKLFNKIGKKNYLTPEGEIFFNYVKRIFSLYNESKEILKKSSKIRIGASTTIGIYILPNIIKEFLEKYGNQIDISIKIENTENILNYILENKVDFAFIEGTTNHKDIISKNFWTDELIFINKFSDKNLKINKKDLVNEKMIMREIGSGTRERFEISMNKENVDFNISFELGNTEAIKKVVEAGMGISCLSKLTVQKEIEEKKLSQLFVDNIKIERFFKLIYHKDKYFNKNMNKFLDFLCNN